MNSHEDKKDDECDDDLCEDGDTCLSCKGRKADDDEYYKSGADRDD